jgi:AhpD family alkylhydroperoxidase
MRLAILDHGHTLGTKVMFALIRAMSRQPVLDVIKLTQYRPHFYGRPMSAITQEAMRRPSSWSVGDRELMGAVVAQANHSEWCTQAHAAVARRAYHDEPKVAAVLANLETAPIAEPLRATLRLLQQLTRDETVAASDMRTVLAAGVSREQVADALAVFFALNTISRLAVAFEFSVPSRAAFDAGAKYVLARGYR